MRQVQVVGAGECGLPLAHQLLQRGWPVTLVTDRSAGSLLTGSVTGAQLKYSATLDIQNDLGLGFWQDSAPKIRGVDVMIVAGQQVGHTWAKHFVRSSQSVDQRTVFARWLDLYTRMGGNLVIDELSRDIIEDWAAEFELTVVTRGAPDLMDCFPARGRWNPARPVRRTTVFYLDGVRPHAAGMGSCVVLPGLGEIISYAALTGRPGAERACEVLSLEAVPGEDLDVFAVAAAPDERLRRAMQALEQYLPEQIWNRFRHAELTDIGATATGDVAPQVRAPVGVLPSGRPVLGGDEVIRQLGLSDAKGANNAVHCALRYAERILANERGTFDQDWMWRTANLWSARRSGRRCRSRKPAPA
ncbi:styrene monooxygenase/indole monooxygenase family protein [Nocardia brasiliensis]